MNSFLEPEMLFYYTGYAGITGSIDCTVYCMSISSDQEVCKLLRLDNIGHF